MAKKQIGELQEKKAKLTVQLKREQESPVKDLGYIWTLKQQIVEVDKEINGN